MVNTYKNPTACGFSTVSLRKRLLMDDVHCSAKLRTEAKEARFSSSGTTCGFRVSRAKFAEMEKYGNHLLEKLSFVPRYQLIVRLQL
jgi:hypothetical protein